MREVHYSAAVLHSASLFRIGNSRALESYAGFPHQTSRLRNDGNILMLIKTIQQAKRWVKIVFGFTLLALGVIMIVTPGPGWLIILLGLGILAAEFVWARTLLDRLKQQGMRLRDVFVRQPADPTGHS
jgi:uncharacterized protein (TIGR02611 family)